MLGRSVRHPLAVRRAVVLSSTALAAACLTSVRAWTSSARSNAGLVDNLMRDGVIRSREVENAMRILDRANFVVDTSTAYFDAPQPLGYGATISAPHMHAHTLERLRTHIKSGARILDVGSGSGYLTAALALLAGPSGRCFGIEVVEPLVTQARQNVEKDRGGDFLSRVVFRVGDGWNGLPDEAPFDAIHVGAAAAEIPQALVDQLAPGGRLVIPVGSQGGAQELVEVDKDDKGKTKTTVLMGVRYVPLVRTEDSKTAAYQNGA